MSTLEVMEFRLLLALELHWLAFWEGLISFMKATPEWLAELKEAVRSDVHHFFYKTDLPQVLGFYFVLVPLVLGWLTLLVMSAMG